MAHENMRRVPVLDAMHGDYGKPRPALEIQARSFLSLQVVASVVLGAIQSWVGI